MKNNENAIINEKSNINATMWATSYAMPKNLDILRSKQAEAEEKFAILVSLYNSENATATALEEAEKSVTKALALINAAIVEQWCDEMKEVSKEEAMTTYINYAGELGGFRLKKPSKNNADEKYYAIESTQRMVSFATVNKHLNLASCSEWSKRLGDFVHNVARNICAKENGIGAQAPKFYGTAPSKEEAPLFCKFSKSDLKKQMDLIAKKMCPEGMEEIHFHSHDVNYLLFAVTKASTGKNAHVELAKELATLNAIVTAMYHRVNNVPYEFQSKAKVHKEDKK